MDSHLAVWVVLIAMGTVMMIILFLVIIYRKKIARFIMSSQREGLVHWTREPAIHVTDNSYQDQIQELRGLVLKIKILQKLNKINVKKISDFSIDCKKIALFG